MYGVRIMVETEALCSRGGRNQLSESSQTEALGGTLTKNRKKERKRP